MVREADEEHGLLQRRLGVFEDDDDDEAGSNNLKKGTAKTTRHSPGSITWWLDHSSRSSLFSQFGFMAFSCRVESLQVFLWSVVNYSLPLCHATSVLYRQTHGLMYGNVGIVFSVCAVG
jgi:hypothetical protein